MCSESKQMRSRDVAMICLAVVLVLAGFFVACIKGCEQVSEVDKEAMKHGYIRTNGVWLMPVPVPDRVEK